MSETVTFVWKIKKLQLEWTIEEKYKAVALLENDWVIPEHDHDSWQEYFYDTLMRDTDDKYIQHQEEIYQVISKNNIYWHDIFESNYNNDDTISFQVSYYNWWCSFSEALDCALSNIK